MAPQAKPDPEMVKHPLTPTVLSEIGVLDETPLPSGPFDPTGDWTHTYRVWTCYGYRNQSNRDQGTLAIGRSARTGRKRLDLTVDQTLRMDPKKHECDHHLSAQVVCRSDLLATPVEWTLTSEFAGGAEGQNPADMNHAEAVKLSGRALRVRIRDRVFRRQVSDRFTADWCLFEAVPRLPFGAGDAVRFDLLEGLTMWKPGQRLTYRGELPVRWDDESASLHCFQQLGMGVWPYEFWLDGQHRLVVVITGVRVYILQPEQGAS